MLKKSVLPAGEQTIAFMFVKSIIIAVIVSLGRPYAPFSLCMKSTTGEKSMNSNVALRFFTGAPLMKSQMYEPVCIYVYVCICISTYI